MRPKLMFLLLGAICVASSFLISQLYASLYVIYEEHVLLNSSEYLWIFRLILNIVGYSTVLLPAFILFKYVERTNYFDKYSNTGFMSRALFACFGEPNEKLPETITKGVKPEESSVREGIELMFCFSGLMTMYLIWGLLQEKIMTQKYILADGGEIRFTDSQFLVFINRFLAFTIALSRLICTGQPLTSAPLYKLAYSSFTNVVSAWCQYEALKYVSFPTQVLSKSCKVIPVMMMGKLVSHNKYSLYEYVTAVLISVGMVLFMLGSNGDTASTVTTVSGLTLLVLYMVCDSFTSSWQGAVFTKYRCTPLQMLCGVNLFSCLLTAASLIQQPTTDASIRLLQHPVFATDVFLLSISSALGQMLIYRTIARFGAVVFTIIMTLRQAVSILLSCLIYGHQVSFSGVTGVILVFVAVLLRVYCRQRIARAKRRPAAV